MVKNIALQELSSIATVIEIKNNTFMIESNGRRKQANKAVSCLITPKKGDKVSLLFDQSDIYIVHVLTSEHQTAIQEKELYLDIETLHLKSKLFNFNINSILSKIDTFNAFIKTIDISSLLTKFSSQEVHTTAQTKKEFTQFRSNHYNTIDTTVNSVEKTHINISKQEVHVEHKNVGSLFTKASGQIKFDAENINLG